MKKLIVIFINLSCGFANAQQFFPFVQTHTFEMQPYFKNSQGYAFFVASSAFTGQEKVTVQAPAGVLFPDTRMNQRVLTQFGNNMWFISDKERASSATSGALIEGTYVFKVSSATKTSEVRYKYERTFLKPVSEISVKDDGDHVEAHWISDPRADTFFVFVFPVESRDIFNDLVAVSSVMHRPTSIAFSKSQLTPGKYKIAIRANELWEGGTFWAIKSEAWSISGTGFSVP